ncbi:hypothetical protein M9H77_01891 [Catharanthus roseus]|uniref:Uncharacterized protein n=1 Tax=Catharanthus roseus TaxID=4058 RepID=A0ACC0C6Z3_CATRO|nr:hypothetical protein M9H77_01891 [Catharanthus roseus]
MENTFSRSFQQQRRHMEVPLLARVCSSTLSQVKNNLRGSKTFIIQNPPHFSHHLTNDIIRYNPFNIGLWVNSFSSELSRPALPIFPSLPDPNLGSTSTIRLKELPIMAPQQNFSSIIFLRMKREQEDSSIQLIHVMMTCAGTIQCGNLSLAYTLVEKLQGLLACMHSTSAIGKVASYFIDALNQRIFTASQGNNSVTFLPDNEIFFMQGLQWPSLIQALALCPEGPPWLHITGIGPPSTNDCDSLGEIGIRLAEFARSVNVNLAFRGVVALRFDDIKPWLLQTSQLIGLNLIHGSLIELVLNWIRNLNPKVIIVVEQEVDHNQAEFLDWRTEALFYYSTKFNSSEGSSTQPEKG